MDIVEQFEREIEQRQKLRNIGLPDDLVEMMIELEWQTYALQQALAEHKSGRAETSWSRATLDLQTLHEIFTQTRIDLIDVGASEGNIASFDNAVAAVLRARLLLDHKLWLATGVEPVVN